MAPCWEKTLRLPFGWALAIGRDFCSVSITLMHTPSFWAWRRAHGLNTYDQQPNKEPNQ
jgi:hypothetical protein